MNKERNKKVTPERGGASVEATSRAVDKYLDDDEWWEQERLEGRDVRIQGFLTIYGQHVHQL